MPYIMVRGYTSPPAPSAFDGVFAISPTPFPPDFEGSGSSIFQQVFTNREIIFDPNTDPSAFGWDGSGNIYLLAAPELAYHREQVAQLGTARWVGSGAAQNINQAAPTAINFGTPQFVDDTFIDDVSATQKDVTKDGLYRIEASVTGVQSGGADQNPFIGVRINGSVPNESLHYAIGVNNGDAITLKSWLEVYLNDGDSIEIIGQAAGGTGSDLDTEVDKTTLMIKRIGGV